MAIFIRMTLHCLSNSDRAIGPVTLSVFLLIIQRSFLPFEVSGNGDGDIESVEAGGEGQPFIDIEGGELGIDDNPQQPLLHVFAGEPPQSDEAQRVAERVGDGHGGVGEADENPVDQCPGSEKEQQRGNKQTALHVCDRHVALMLLSAFLAQLPYKQTVDGS